MNTPDLQRFPVVCDPVSDLYCPGFNPRATRYKLDPMKITADVRAELSKRADNRSNGKPKPKAPAKPSSLRTSRAAFSDAALFCFSGFCRCATTAASGHFLRHDHDEFPVWLRRFAQALSQFVKVGRLFAAAAKCDV